MTAYWLLFSLPIIQGLVPLFRADVNRRLAWLLMAVVAVIFIGLRREVGADWDTYLETFEFLDFPDLIESITVGDPAYVVLNWLAGGVGLGIYGVNLFCGLVFATGLSIFCSRQPVPWLAWLVATPYLLIVVAMGYSRQGVALGFLLWGLTYLEDRRVWHYLLLVTLGASFHQSAFLMLPLAFLVRTSAGWRERLVLGLVVAAGLGLLFAGGYDLFGRYQSLWFNYVEEQITQSEGADVRAWMNALPAIIMLAVGAGWQQRWPDPGHWRWLAVAAIASVFLTGVSSTAVDRTGLYLTPLQLYVWSRVPMLSSDELMGKGISIVVCLGYAAVLWVWLNFAIHSFAWLPYKNVLLPS